MGLHEQHGARQSAKRRSDHIRLVVNCLLPVLWCACGRGGFDDDNTPPIPRDDGPFVVSGGTSTAGLRLLENDTDLDGDTLELHIIKQPASGTVVIEAGRTTVTYTPAGDFHGADEFRYVVRDARGATAEGLATLQVVTPFLWTGLGQDTAWTDGANWCGLLDAGRCQGGAPPGPENTAVFDSTCSACDVTIDTSISIRGLRMEPGYPGTIRQGTDSVMAVGAVAWQQASGTFVGSNADISIVAYDAAGTHIQGGSFTSTSGIWSIRYAVTIGPDAVFNHNGGTLAITSDCGCSGDRGNIDVGGARFNDVTVTRVHGLGTVVGTFRIDGDLTIDATGQWASLHSGTVEVAGDLDIRTSTAVGSGWYRLVGSTDQTLAMTSGAMQNLEIASTGGVVTLIGTVGVYRDFTHTSGVVDASAATVQFVGDCTCMSRVSAAEMTFGNLLFNKAYGSGIEVDGVVNVGGDLIINNQGSQTNHVDGGTLRVMGNYVVESGEGGTASVVMMGATNRTITQTGGEFPAGELTIDKPGATVSLSSGTALGGGATLTAGTLDMAGFDLSVVGALILESGTTLIQSGGVLTAGTLVNNGAAVLP